MGPKTSQYEANDDAKQANIEVIANEDLWTTNASRPYQRGLTKPKPP